MSPHEIRVGVLETLLGIAPEIETDQLVAAKPLRSQVDLDSMDWLNFIIGLHQRFHVNIPEADYATLTTLDTIVAYLAARLG
jgi:acyl carrier protein